MLRREFIAGAATAPIISSKPSEAQPTADEDVRKAAEQLVTILGRIRGGTWARSSDAAGDFILFRKISA